MEAFVTEATSLMLEEFNNARFRLYTVFTSSSYCSSWGARGLAGWPRSHRFGRPSSPT
jgi:hypothetical protein